MHSFSIASILGDNKPTTKKRQRDEDYPNSSVQAMGSNPATQRPLLTSTPLSKDMSQNLHSSADIIRTMPQEYTTSSHGREDLNSITPVTENGDKMKESMLPPSMESSTRVEKWVLENCVRENVSPDTNRRDILAESFALAMGESDTTEQSENGEDKSAGSGSHDRSFMSESCSRPGSPDYDRRPSKKARTSFSASQLCSLETKYRTQRYISAADRIKLARKLKLSDQQVKTWYQNRRMKEKRHLQDMEHAKKFNAVAQGMAALQNPSTFIFSGHSKLPGATVTSSAPTFPQVSPVTSLPQPGSIDFLNQQMQIGQQQIMNTPPVMGSFTAMLSSQAPLVSPHAMGSQVGQSIKGQSSQYLPPTSNSSLSPPATLAHAYPPIPFTSGQMSSAFTRMAPSTIPTSFPAGFGYPMMHPLTQSVM